MENNLSYITMLSLHLKKSFVVFPKDQLSACDCFFYILMTFQIYPTKCFPFNLLVTQTYFLKDIDRLISRLYYESGTLQSC